MTPGMSEPNFSFASLPDCLMVEIAQRIEAVRCELQQPDPAPLTAPLRVLSHVRGNFALDLISSVALASQIVCESAAADGRTLSSGELRSLHRAVQTMDRARRTAVLSAAM